MTELEATVTRKGQITVPVALRRAWGLKEGDRVVFLLEDHQVRLTPRGSVVAETAGIFRKYSQGQPPTDEELRDVVETAIAEEVAESLGR